MLTTVAILLTVFILANPIACSSSSANDTGGTTLTVSNLGKDISQTTGVMEEISFTVSFNLDRFGGPFSSLRIDLQAHVSVVTISVPGVSTSIPFPLQSVKPAYAAVDGSQLFLRAGTAEQIDTVCAEGELYGPFSRVARMKRSEIRVDVSGTRHTPDSVSLHPGYTSN